VASPGTSSASGRGVDAAVGNSWDEVREEYVGVRYHLVCQERHGPRETESTVGNKLDNGMFIPDMYVDPTKVQGETPPAGLPNR
jgi:hypothetical protein